VRSSSIVLIAVRRGRAVKQVGINSTRIRKLRIEQHGCHTTLQSQDGARQHDDGHHHSKPPGRRTSKRNQSHFDNGAISHKYSRGANANLSQEHRQSAQWSAVSIDGRGGRINIELHMRPAAPTFRHRVWTGPRQLSYTQQHCRRILQPE
jgi:hypothetical protein